MGSILGRELDVGIELYLTIRCTFLKQGTFRVSCGFNAVCKDHINAILGIPEGGMLAMGLVMPMGGCTVGGTVRGTVGLAMAGHVTAC